MTEFVNGTFRVEKALEDPEHAARVAEVRAEMKRDDEAFARLSGHLRAYFDDPDAWDSIKNDILKHDPTCESRGHIWLGRTGGVSSPSDLGTCDDCKVTFYNEGLTGQYPPGWKTGDYVLQNVDDDGEETEATLCECCGRKRLAEGH